MRLLRADGAGPCAPWSATRRPRPTWPPPAPSWPSPTWAARRRSTRPSTGSRPSSRRPTRSPPIRPGDSAAAVDAGYAELVRRAERSGVARFVLASVPETELDDTEVPVARTKRRTEQLLAESGLSWLSLRMPRSPRSGWPWSAASCRCGARSGRRWAGRTRPSAGSAGSPAARSTGTALMVVPGPAVGAAGVPLGARRGRGARGGGPARTRAPGRSTSAAPRSSPGPTSPRSTSGCSAAACASSASPPPPSPSSSGCSRPWRRPWPV